MWLRLRMPSWRTGGQIEADRWAYRQMSKRIQQTIETNIINEIGRSCILFLREERQSKVAVLVAIRVTGERKLVFKLSDAQQVSRLPRLQSVLLGEKRLQSNLRRLQSTRVYLLPQLLWYLLVIRSQSQLLPRQASATQSPVSQVFPKPQ